MKSTRTTLAFFLLAAAPAALTAQTKPAGVVGWAWNNGSTTVCSQVYTQDVDNSCQKAVSWGTSLCAQKGTMGGGTAYDARSFSVFTSDGATIAVHNLIAKKDLCTFSATLASKGGVITGLAMSDATRELWQAEFNAGTLYLSSYDVTNPCSPKHKANTCKIAVTGTGAISAGLAFDEVRKLLYYSVSISGIAGWTNEVRATSTAKPCSDVGKFFVAACGSRPGSPISGLGYDSCSQRLYAASEGGVRTILVTDPIKGIVTDLSGSSCCAFTGTGVWMGLDVIPSSDVTSFGKSCVTSTCAGSCTPTASISGGDASLGNQDFQFDLAGAPGASMGWFYVSVGKCTAGVQIPSLCGPVYPSLMAPNPLLFGVFNAGGTAGSCNGQVQVKTGVPVDPFLCKTPLCVQWVVVCPKAGSGLSNALQITFGG